MQVILAPSSVASADPARQQYLTSFLVNDTLAVDAGSLGLCGPPERQARIRHVLISHAHIDHIATLPIFLENIYDVHSSTVTIHGSTETIAALRRHIFNDEVWPDLIRLAGEHAPFFRLMTLEPGRTIELEGLRITPVPVDHVVPTLGFLLQDEHGTVVIPSDTAPTDEIWRQASAREDVRAVFLEATFPNRLRYLAEVSKHLTPTLFAQEAAKLHRSPALIAVHIKARFQEEVVQELHSLGLPNLEIGQPGKTYTF